jgi:predicted nucleic acid-binding protein
MRIHVRGSIGVLLYGFDKNVLTASDVDAALEGMKKAERRISKDLYDYAHEYVRR